jgi:hypothetical protein
VADGERVSTRRLWIVLLPSVLFGSTLVGVLVGPSVGLRLSYGTLCAVLGIWLVHAWRVGVELTTRALVVNDQFRKHTIACGDVREARLEPMRTASLFAGRWPYVALAVVFADGRTKQYQGVSVASSQSKDLRSIVVEINRRIEGA